MISDDLRVLCDALEKSLTEETEAIKDNLAQGTYDTSNVHTPYPYWVGLYKGEMYALNELKRLRRRFEGGQFEEEGE